MNSRVYNKLYVNTNRDEGSEKLLLGYQHDGKELVLKANQTTYFHIPYYTDPIRLTDSSLIADGATAGPFPAASDRIFKSKRNYGNVTADGNPSDIADAVWFCSWLHKDSSGVVQWVDRYYNPGSLQYSIATDQLSVPYTPYNPIFRDIPSQMVFDPGVLYKYFHAGEENAQFLVTSFGGLTGERLLMNLENWGTNSVDSSQNNLQLNVITNAPSSKLYATLEEKNRISKPVIRFDNNYDTSISINYANSYAKNEEFTWIINSKSPNWNQCQTTQLIGNYSSQGGVGLFVETLSSFPFFVIPETNYGHILYLNEGINGFLDKSVQTAFAVNVNPQLVCIDSNQRVVVCHNDSSGFIYKLDSVGNVITSTKQKAVPFAYFYEEEFPLQILCGKEDQIIIRTNRNIYTFDSELNLQSYLILNSSLSSVAAFRYNEEMDFSELDITNNVYDSKFIGTTQWFLSRMDGNLYKKVGSQTTLFYQFSSPATTFAIDPQERLWVLHGTNDVTIINSKANPLDDPILVTDVGANRQHQNKNISFICQYDRVTQTRSWKAIIYYSEDGTIYTLELDGQLYRSVDLTALFNSTNLTILNQNSEQFKFLGKGDFTGYEHRRVFKNLSPFNNKSQLVLRTALKDKTDGDLIFGYFKQQVPIDQWDFDSWQQIALVLRNKTFRVFVNGVEKIKWTYPSKYELSYEIQPAFTIGSSNGAQSNFNQEIQYVSSIFNGIVEDVKIYDYGLEPNCFDSFLRASTPATDIFWSLPVPDIQYIEKIERMFKNKIPGFKAPFYKIKIKGMQIQDEQTRQIIEEQVRMIAQKIQPAYADFLEVHWID